ncbi:hypothetical protein PanWU01x14_360370 [Parasponia andersonii]|uniref:Uncharacterized protein n=1 Tax=Parasponia andersonii TaxID=3476 RepID=A0A2P5A7M0_PARAD|nr:hypothetical protein PanWU01x14_360370 [Parasponia andersonii]
MAFTGDDLLIHRCGRTAFQVGVRKNRTSPCIHRQGSQCRK